MERLKIGHSFAGRDFQPISGNGCIQTAFLQLEKLPLSLFLNIIIEISFKPEKYLISSILIIFWVCVILILTSSVAFGTGTIDEGARSLVLRRNESIKLPKYLNFFVESRGYSVAIYVSLKF